MVVRNRAVVFILYSGCSIRPCAANAAASLCSLSGFSLPVVNPGTLSRYHQGPGEPWRALGEKPGTGTDGVVDLVLKDPGLGCHPKFLEAEVAGNARASGTADYL